MDVSGTLEITCNDSNAEVGSTLKTSIILTCSENGTFLPDPIPKCEVPSICPDDSIPEPSADSGLIFKNLTGGPIQAYRFATYACNDTSLLTDEGKTYEVKCLQDGTFESSDLGTLTCREPFKCPEYIPYPTQESGLQVKKYSFWKHSLI